MAEGDVDVELKDEIVEAKLPGTTTADPPDAISADIAAVQRNLDEERAKSRRLEQERNEALQRASQVEAGVYGDRLALVQSALDTIDANVATLQAQMTDAMAAGDFAKHSELNVALAKQLAQQPDLLRGKAALEQASKQPQPTRADQLTDAQKVDLYVKNMQPRAAAWVRAHPEYVTDPKLNNKLNAKHYAALDAGHTEGTDGYFNFIEESLKPVASNGHADPAAEGGGAPDPTAAAAQIVRTREDAQPPAAAPSRGGGGGRTIRLTKDQQDAARMSGLSNEEYAANMVREQKAGNIGKGRLN